MAQTTRRRDRVTQARRERQREFATAGVLADIGGAAEALGYAVRHIEADGLSDQALRELQSARAYLAAAIEAVGRWLV